MSKSFRVIISRLKYPQNCFSSLFCFLMVFLLIIMLTVLFFYRYNKSFFAFFYVVFMSLCWYIDAIFNAGESSSCFFSWYVFRSLLFLMRIVSNYYCYLLFKRKLMVFHWRLSNSKSPQVSRTLLSILAVFNNAVVWMVFTCPPISKSSSPFSNPLVTVPNSPITIGIIVTCMFHSFFNSLARSRYLSFFSHSFSFILWSAETAKSTILLIFFFFFCWSLLGLVFWPSTLCEFFITVLIGGLSLKSEKQQVSSDFLDSSKYSSWEKINTCQRAKKAVNHEGDGDTSYS